MGMTDEQLYEAQPEKDFVFQLVDQEPVRLTYRMVTVPNWIARDGRWAEIYNALMASRNGEVAKATEMIVKALERAREYGRQDAETGHEPEGRYHVERWQASYGPESYVAKPLTSAAKSRLDLQHRQHRGLRRPFDPAFPETQYGGSIPVFEL